MDSTQKSILGSNELFKTLNAKRSQSSADTDICIAKEGDWGPGAEGRPVPGPEPYISIQMLFYIQIECINK